MFTTHSIAASWKVVEDKAQWPGRSPSRWAGFERPLRSNVDQTGHVTADIRASSFLPEHGDVELSYIE